MTLSWNMFRPLLLLLWCINLLSCQECNISEDDLDMDAAMHGLRSGMREIGMSRGDVRETLEILEMIRYYGDQYPIPWHELEAIQWRALFEKGPVVQYAHAAADELAADIGERRGKQMPPREGWLDTDGVDWQEAEMEWIKMIGVGSIYSIAVMDQQNIFLNSGNISIARRFLADERQWEWLEALKSFFEQERMIHDFVYSMLPQYLQMIRHMDLDPMFAMAIQEASCAYDKAARSKSTFLKTLTAAQVPKEKFLKYITELAESIKTLLKSDKLDKGVQMFYEHCVEEFNKLDFNSFTLTTYKFLLEVRTLLLKMDIKAQYMKLDELTRIVEEGFTKIMYGRWPEMETFLDNLLRLTFASENFWIEFDKLYQKALVKWREVYDDRQMSLTMQMEQVILPFFRDLLTQINIMASGDKQSFGKLGELFDAFIEWQHDIHRFIGLFSRDRFACWVAQNLVPFFEVKNIIVNDDGFKSLQTLLFSDWPATEVYPKSVDEFLRNIYETFNMLVTGFSGLCQI